MPPARRSPAACCTSTPATACWAAFRGMCCGPLPLSSNTAAKKSLPAGLDHLHGLLDLSILLRFHLVAFFDAKSLIEDLALEAISDELALARPVADSRLD